MRPEHQPIEVSGYCSAILDKTNEMEAEAARPFLQHTTPTGGTYELVGMQAYTEKYGLWLDITEYPGAWDLPLRIEHYTPAHTPFS